MAQYINKNREFSRTPDNAEQTTNTGKHTTNNRVVNKSRANSINEK